MPRYPKKYSEDFEFQIPAVPTRKPPRKKQQAQQEFDEIEIVEHPIVKMEMNDEPVIETEEENPVTEKEAEMIMGAAMSANGDRFYIIKWKNSLVADKVPEAEVKEKWPGLLIDYFTERKAWIGSDEVVD